jgi:DNA-binding MarR family transcriptional regulator
MSSAPATRQNMMAALNLALRDVSGLGVLYSEAIAARLGVNGTDLECLGLVAARGPLAAGELAAATGLTTGAITGVIDRLTRAGYARRVATERDRRKVLVEAIPAALEGAAALYEPMERRAMAALSSYSDEELAFVLTFLERSLAAAREAMTELRGLDSPGPKARRAPSARASRESR